VSVNVAANSKIDFALTYEELLQRRLGVYEHVINIDPGQVVRDLRVDVVVKESREITSLQVPPLRYPEDELLSHDLASGLKIQTSSSFLFTIFVYRKPYSSD
jgi:hypothetical protein